MTLLSLPDDVLRVVVASIGADHVDHRSTALACRKLSTLVDALRARRLQDACIEEARRALSARFVDAMVRHLECVTTVAMAYVDGGDWQLSVDVCARRASVKMAFVGALQCVNEYQKSQDSDARYMALGALVGVRRHVHIVRSKDVRFVTDWLDTARPIDIECAFRITLDEVTTILLRRDMAVRRESGQASNRGIAPAWQECVQSIITTCGDGK